MIFRSTHRRSGFTLIELIVVIAILATLVSIAAPAFYNHLKAGDVTKCRTQLEQISKLGLKYSQDMAHKALLPTSGMDDDEDTKTVNESDGWWISVAPELDSTVYPRSEKAKMKVSTIFHCPSDLRVNVGSDSVMLADEKSVSYVSWTDASEDRDNPNSCIRTTARQNLDTLPWLSDGNPVKGQSVTDLATFRKMVMPALERHDSTIVVVYASGAVKAVKVEDDENVDAEALFKRIAPSLANKKQAEDEDEDADDEESGEDDTEE
ncbi:MAG: type II secretion system protein [Akkermansia sp.]|nr:type II secretion system protein [Akkermansia sp.]